MRKVLSLLVAATFGLGLVGCGGETKKPEPKKDKPAETKPAETKPAETK
ncbi:MAG: hypothetical protein V1899_11170 [Planctomycetota bacterium]